MVIFKFKGKEYEIIQQKGSTQSAEWILTQFEYAVKTNQYTTIKHRIVNGLMYGWMREISKN